MYGKSIHISVWEKRYRQGRTQIHRRNYIDRIVSKEGAEKLNRHYNRRSAISAHE